MTSWALNLGAGLGNPKEAGFGFGNGSQFLLSFTGLQIPRIGLPPSLSCLARHETSTDQ
jgi:hypothetical protein